MRTHMMHKTCHPYLRYFNIGVMLMPLSPRCLPTGGVILWERGVSLSPLLSSIFTFYQTFLMQSALFVCPCCSTLCIMEDLNSIFVYCTRYEREDYYLFWKKKNKAWEDNKIKGNRDSMDERTE